MPHYIAFFARYEYVSTIPTKCFNMPQHGVGRLKHFWFVVFRCVYGFTMVIAAAIFRVFNQAMSQVISNKFAERCNAAAIIKLWDATKPVSPTFSTSPGCCRNYL